MNRPPDRSRRYGVRQSCDPYDYKCGSPMLVRDGHLVITRNGKPVAQLVPPQRSAAKQNWEE
jgi:hypothetical protein